MKIYKKKGFWIVIIILLLVGGGAVLVFKNNNKEPKYQTAKVARGELTRTVSATGKVQSASEMDLNFKIIGRLAGIYAKVGETKKAGGLLAKLESRQAASAVISAEAQLKEAEADLEKVQAGSSNEDISVTQAKLEQAKVDLQAKQNAVEQAQKDKEENLLSLKEQSINTVNDSAFTATQALEDIDALIFNYSYNSYLSLFIISFGQAQSDYQTAQTNLTALKGIINNYSSANGLTELTFLLDQTDNVLKEVDTALSSTYNLFSIVQPDTNLSQTNIDTAKTNVTTDQGKIVSDITSIQTAKSDLQIKSVDYDQAIEDAEDDVAKAQAAITLAEAELNLKLAGPRSFEITAAEAKVKTAAAKLQSAQADLVEYSLISPLDAVITKVNYEVGEFVSQEKPVVSLISESNLEIEVDVPESDIAKIKVSDSAQITLDAFGEDRTFASQIISIEPASTVINDVVYYKVKLVFAEKDEAVKVGMTANVDIISAKKENVLTVPSRAVIGKNGDSYVRALNNGVINEKKVVTGLKGDGEVIEIIVGLIEGEEVVTYVKNGK